MQPYLETHLIGNLLLRGSKSEQTWQLLRREFRPPFLVVSFQALRIEHMLLHQKEEALRAAAFRGFQTWQRNLQEGVFQLAAIEWEGACRLALDLNRRGLDHSIGPLHYFEAACASMLAATHFVSFEPKSRAVAATLGIPLLPEKV